MICFRSYPKPPSSHPFRTQVPVQVNPAQPTLGQLSDDIWAIETHFQQYRRLTAPLPRGFSLFLQVSQFLLVFEIQQAHLAAVRPLLTARSKTGAISSRAMEIQDSKAPSDKGTVMIRVEGCIVSKRIQRQASDKS